MPFSRFYLGPEDHAPRGLYWCLIIILLIDLGFAAANLIALARSDHQQVLFHRLIRGAIISTIIPIVVTIAVWNGHAWVAGFFAFFKAFAGLSLLASVFGHSLAGESIESRLWLMRLGWHLVAGTVAGFYCWIRLRQSRTHR